MTESIRVLVAREYGSACLHRPARWACLSPRWDVLEPTLTDEAAVRALEAGRAQVCILDREDADSALRFLAAARARGCRAPVLALLPASQSAWTDALLAAGAGEVLIESDLDESRLERALEGLCQQSRAGEALRSSWRRFHALLEHSTEGVLVLDRAGKVRYSNDAVLPLLGYRPHELIGKYLLDSAHPDDARSAVALFDDAADSSPHPATGRFRIEHRDGTWRHLDWVMASHLDDPDVRGVVVNCRDVTDQQHALEQLRHASQRLDRQERLWSTLMAVSRALQSRADDRRGCVDAALQTLSSNWSGAGPVGVRVDAGGMTFSTAALPTRPACCRGAFRMPDGQAARLEVLAPEDGEAETMDQIKRQELVDAVCLMLQGVFSNQAPAANISRADGQTSVAQAARDLDLPWPAGAHKARVM